MAMRRAETACRDHPGVDRVAHDPVGEYVFDRAEIQFCFRCGVFGDVTEPQLIWMLRGEILVNLR